MVNKSDIQNSSGKQRNEEKTGLWRLDLSRLKKIKVRDYAIRFLFGGLVSVLAALIADWTTGRIGGIFTAFPAILLASLTIINRKDGKEAASDDARGGVLGAIALVVCALVLSVTLGSMGEWWSLLLSLLLWLACSIGLYVLCARSGLLSQNQE